MVHGKIELRGAREREKETEGGGMVALGGTETHGGCTHKLHRVTDTYACTPHDAVMNIYPYQ